MFAGQFVRQVRAVEASHSGVRRQQVGVEVANVVDEVASDDSHECISPSTLCVLSNAICDIQTSSSATGECKRALHIAEF